MTARTVRAGQRPGLVYERRGSGESLLLLHGFGHSRRTWDPVMDRVAVERDVIAVDMPGFGLSRCPTRPCCAGEGARDRPAGRRRPYRRAPGRRRPERLG
ncbi:MAG: alpha/beta fold hydrolase, partial [Actinomycetota bacterium]|nr:alpha/beta fold hydrolase [Actinomycetota bacterium]